MSSAGCILFLFTQTQDSTGIKFRVCVMVFLPIHWGVSLCWLGIFRRHGFSSENADTLKSKPFVGMYQFQGILHGKIFSKAQDGAFRSRGVRKGIQHPHHPAELVSPRDGDTNTHLCIFLSTSPHPWDLAP